MRIYLPDDVGDAPVIISSEVRNNPGGSVTSSAEVIAAGLIRANRLPTPLVWTEHVPEESTDGGEERFDLVVFSSYDFVEDALLRGDEAMDRRRNLEAARLRHHGSLGGRKGTVALNWM